MISIIAAIQKKDRGIGYKNELLFRISDDHKRFKSLTMGHPIIMGRKTFESIGKALPGRTNIVITRQENKIVDGIIFARSLEHAIQKAKESVGSEEIFIIGGGQIYNEALPFANKLYLTYIEGNKPCDTFFPDYSEFKKIVHEESHMDETPQYTFIELEK